MSIADPLSDAVKSKVKRQVEFYFSDSNAPRDKFLMEQIEADPEGYVELSLICSFSRMTALLDLPAAQKPEEVPNVCISKVAEVLRNSDTLIVSEDGQKVKRRFPLKPHDELVKEMDERSLFVAPFPYDCKLDALTELFGKIAPVKCVRMRRNLTTKDFRGSIFVEFDSRETAEKVLAMDLEHMGAKLRLEPKLAFIERKIKERKEKPNAIHPMEPSEQEKPNATHPSEPSEQEPLEQQESWEASPSEAPGASLTVSGTPANGAAAGDQEASKGEEAAKGDEAEGGEAPAKAPPPEARKPPPMPEYESGKILRFTFQGVEEVGGDMHYKNIKEAFGGKDTGVVYVEYAKGELYGQIRMTDKDKAAAALERRDADGNISIGAYKAAVTVLEGTPERQFYERAHRNRIEQSAREQPGGGLFVVQKRENRKRNFQGGGGRGRFGKRGRSF